MIEPTKSTTPNGSTVALEGQLEIGRMFAALKRGKWIIAGITVAVTAIAATRALLSPATYQAYFEVLIQPSSAETEAISSVSNFTVNQAQRTISLQDQMRILTSPKVLQPAIEELLETVTDICQEESLPIDMSATLEETKLQCGYGVIEGPLRVSLLEEGALSVEGSRIFRTQFSSESEDFARYVADLVAKTYLDYGLESRKQDIQQALLFLESKLPDLGSSVDLLEEELQALRETNNLITPEARGQQLTQQIATTSQQYLAVQVELQEARALVTDLQQQLQQRPEDAIASPFLSNSQRYQSLIQQLLTLDSQIAEASTLFLEGSPDMVVLRDQRRNLLGLLAREGQQAQQELIGQITALETRESALSQTLTALNQDVNALAGLSRRYSDLERNLLLATENLTRLQQTQETLELEAAQRELPWELITPTTVRTQSASLARSGILGMGVGLILGMGVVLARDTLKNALYSPEDIKRVTPLPVLGLIPSYQLAATRLMLTQAVEKDQLTYANGTSTTDDLERQIAANENDIGPSELMYGDSAQALHRYTSFREAFRTLIANIQRTESKRPIQSAVISSAVAGEGKSTVTAYLALTAAAMGERVLLVDGNLRSPSLHRLLGISEQPGWAEVLTEVQPLHDCMQQSAMEPNLYILPAGGDIADPARVLSPRPIQQFISQAEQEFDLIFIDTPSVLDYADAMLVAAEANGLILVSQLGTLQATQLEQTLERLWISKVKVLGIVAQDQ